MKYSEFIASLSLPTESQQKSTALRTAIDAIELYYNKYFMQDMRYTKDMYVSIDDVDIEELINANDCEKTYINKSELIHRPLYRPLEFYSNAILNQKENSIHLLVGCPGVGKSTFIDHLCDNLVMPKNVHFTRTNFDRGNPTTHEARDKIVIELERIFKTPDYGGHFIKRIDELSSLSSNSVIVHFVDNIDKVSKSPIEINVLDAAREVFTEFSSRARSTRLLFVVCLGRSTLSYIYNEKSDSLRGAISIYMLPSPPLKLVLEKRIPMLQEFIADRSTEAERQKKITNINVVISHSEKYSIDVKLMHVAPMISRLMDNFSSDAYTFLRLITLGGIRTQLKLIPELIKAGTFYNRKVGITLISMLLGKTINEIFSRTTFTHKEIDVYEVLQGLKAFDRRKLQEHDFVCMENLYFNMPYELFDVSQCVAWLNDKKNVSWSMFLCKLRVLQCIKNYASIHSSTEPTVGTVIEILINIAYSEEEILTALISLISNRLVMATNLQTENIRFNKNMELFVSDIGDIYLSKLIKDISYYAAILHKIPSSNLNEKLSPIYNYYKLVQTIRIAEEIEGFVAKSRNYESVENLEKIKDGFCWKNISNVVLNPIKIPIVRYESTDNKLVASQRRGAVKQKVEAARQRRDVIDRLRKIDDWKIYIEIDQNVDPESVHQECVNCIQDIIVNARNGRYVNQYCEKPWKLDPINLLSIEGTQIIFGAEAFYMHINYPHNVSLPYDCKSVKCKAGDLIRYARKIAKRSEHRSNLLIKWLDYVFLNTFKKMFSEDQMIDKLRYVSINISVPVLDEPEYIANYVNELQELSKKVIIELPEDMANKNLYKESICNMVCNAVNGCKDDVQNNKDDCECCVLIGIDDRGSDSARDQQALIEPFRKCIKFEKVDWITFRSMYINRRKDLKDFIVDIAKKNIINSGFVVVEGVKDDMHLSFLYEIIKQHNLNNICVQGEHIKFP